jgi:hypothetical protein
MHFSNQEAAILLPSPLSILSLCRLTNPEIMVACYKGAEVQRSPSAECTPTILASL